MDGYRASKDAEFKKFEAEHTQGNKKAETDANKDAEAKIKEMKEAGKKHQAQVVKDLCNGVVNVSPVAPSKN